jgi:NodT family efflux transporter outer membrane factor (OMF) lipoprotein
LFPQQQTAFGSQSRVGRSIASTIGPFFGSRYFEQWQGGFNLAWELDFWGRFRRAVEAADDQLSASVEDYDAVLVTLLGDVAANYVQVRVDEQRIELLRANANLQREILRIVVARFDAGRVSELDVDQAKSTLAQTEAAIPLLEIDRRQAMNRLCVLLGMPPTNLEERLGKGTIPTPPYDVAAGIPAQLLSRRPDVRRAERIAAAQSEQIGIAQSDLYPAISISGTLGYQAQQFSQLFSSRAFSGSVGPSFQWNILNYGRIVNNVRLQDSLFQELVLAYQQAVLLAAEEAEDGLVTFLRAQERRKLLEESVLNMEKAVKVVIAQYKVGTADFTRVAQIEQDLVTQQDLLAQAEGQIAQGLIQVYRALGGGWQIRLESQEEPAAAPAATPPGEKAPGAPKKPAVPGILEEAAPVPPQKPAPPKDQP